MSSRTLLRGVELALEKDYRRYHVQAQLGRFGTGLALSLIEAFRGAPVVSRSTVLPLIGGALWVATRETWPTVRWDLVVQHLRAGANQPEPSAPPPPPAP